MPLYDYICPSSHTWDEVRSIASRHEAKCPSCGKKGRLTVPRKAPGATTFREGWYDHIAPDPIYCRTPQELREACDRNNARSVYLENSLFKTSPGEERDPIRESHERARNNS